MNEGNDNQITDSMTDHEGDPLATSVLFSGLSWDSEHSWKEDYPHENGKYLHICRECGAEFLGHKRRMICKACSDSILNANY